MVEKDSKEMSISRQCEVLDIHKSALYYTPIPEKEENLKMIELLDKQYFETPFYGALRLTALLQRQGFLVNVKRVRRLMKIID